MSGTINIIGPGSIGVSIAALFDLDSSVRRSFKVRLIGRGTESKVRRESFRFILGQGSPRQITLPIYSGILATLQPDEWIIIVTKAYDLPAILSELQEIFNHPQGTGRKIAVLCNGLGVLERVLSQIPHSNILRGLIHFGAKLTNVDNVKTLSVVGNPRLVLVHEGAEQSHAFELATIFGSAGIEVTVEHDIRTAEWKKAIVNTVVNSIATLLSTCNQGVLDHSVVGSLTRPAFREVLSVAVADGVSLTNMDWETFTTQVQSFGANLNSTLIDFRAGRRTELDFFLGEVLRRGRLYRIQTPVLNSIVEGLEKMGVIF